MKPEFELKPLVYSCSGASSAAQMANHLAVQLDRLGMADMSCIAGLGGDVEPLVFAAGRAELNQGLALVNTLVLVTGGWYMDLRRAHRLWWALFGGMAGVLLLGLLGWVMAGE